MFRSLITTWMKLKQHFRYHLAVTMTLYILTEVLSIK